MISLYNKPLLKGFKEHLISYQSPIVINYFWGFGSLSGVFLMIQILSGVFLSIFYVPSSNDSFSSIEYLIRDVKGGWILRYIHSNGASFFFIVVYFHMFRSFFFSSFTLPREIVWFTGIFIYFLIILTAFVGYVLPWGQMGFWGATVITNIVTAFPFIGFDLVGIVWGGFSVGDSTLHRFFSIHYLTPFVLSGLIIIHILALHQSGSNNPIGVSSCKVSLNPYFSVKDLFGIFFVFIFYLYFVFFAPDFFNHPDNWIPANSMETPQHIVPEWYFLYVYAILRSIPNKMIGVMSILLVFVSFFLLPFIYGFSNRSILFRPFHGFFFWVWLGSILGLSWIGTQPTTSPYVELGQLFTFYFFVYLFQ
jgi:ubiquinol-cytochrome c reductase cytochrome b subunit